MINVISFKEFFVPSDSEKDQLIMDVFHSKSLHDTKPQSPGANTNFQVIKDENNICKKIYQRFFETSEKIFGKITLDTKNSDACWSLCTNKDYWKSVPHHHIATSTINAVYYLQVPKVDEKYCGEILLFDNEKWEPYQPEPYELIIMPNYLVHDTKFHNTEEWRISLNFEITCTNNIEW